jgi:hypothetical protein
MANEARRLGLQAFRAGLEPYLLADQYVRPFVCAGSPLECQSFIVGLNAATQLRKQFLCYWSDDCGFDRRKFNDDYAVTRRRRGNRPRIEAIAEQLAPCLETNLYATPTLKAKQLTKDNRDAPVICYLFATIRPTAVFVHSDEPIHFFARQTGCSEFTSAVKQAVWQGHKFWLYGRPGPLYTASIAEAKACGAKLAEYLCR